MEYVLDASSEVDMHRWLSDIRAHISASTTTAAAVAAAAHPAASPDTPISRHEYVTTLP